MAEMYVTVMDRDPNGTKLAKRIVQIHVSGTNNSSAIKAVCQSLGMVDTFDHFRADCTTAAEIDRVRNALAPYFETKANERGRVASK